MKKWKGREKYLSITDYQGWGESAEVDVQWDGNSVN